MENALKKFIEKSQRTNFEINNNNNNNEKLWNKLNHQKIDLCNFEYKQFKITDDDIENNLEKFQMKIIFSELLKKRNSKSCKYNIKNFLLKFIFN